MITAERAAGVSLVFAGAAGGASALNIFFIVGMAILITVLARYFARHGRPK